MVFFFTLGFTAYLGTKNDRSSPCWISGRHLIDAFFSHKPNAGCNAFSFSLDRRIESPGDWLGRPHQQPLRKNSDATRLRSDATAPADPARCAGHDSGPQASSGSVCPSPVGCRPWVVVVLPQVERKEGDMWTDGWVGLAGKPVTLGQPDAPLDAWKAERSAV
jgi:hypothetical protein